MFRRRSPVGVLGQKGSRFGKRWEKKGTTGGFGSKRHLFGCFFSLSPFGGSLGIIRVALGQNRGLGVVSCGWLSCPTG